METPTIINKQKKIFLICATTMCVCAIVSYFAIPDMSATLSDSTKYTLQLTCSLLPMTIAIIASMQAQRFITKAGNAKKAQTYKRMNTTTMLLFTWAVIMNIIVKYAIDYDSAYYCAAICVIMFALSYPRESKLAETPNK